MFKKLSSVLILTTTLYAEPITPENADNYRCSLGFRMFIMNAPESTLTRFRGGISRQQDFTTSKEIIKNLLENIDRTTLLNTANSLEIAQRLMENVDTYSGFEMIEDNIPARRMYISLCARVLIANQTLTESACVNNARQALAAFRR